MRRFTIEEKKPLQPLLVSTGQMKASDKINDDIAAFLEKGGSVEQVNSGITGFEDLHTDKTHKKH